MSEPHGSALLPLMVEAGGVVRDYHGLSLVRHFGDPQAEYEAATLRAAVFDRSHRTRLKVSGRAPAQMLSGVVTGRVPDDPEPAEDGGFVGVGAYQAILTPKGKMISDAVLFRLGEEEDLGFLLDVPVAGRAGLLEHFGKFMPPRFAKVEDISNEWASISVVGPESAALLSRMAFGLRVDAAWLEASEELVWRSLGDPADGLVVARTAEVWPEAWTVYGPTESVAALWRALVADGASPAGLGVWGTLRVEAGRPVFGTDMDERTIPPEAGIVERAIDQTKGCYTGQEVIVRIRDRGHVNRQLRRLSLGDIPAPSKGTELLAADGSGKVVGELTSIVQSPKAGGVLALAYVRRGVERARLGDVDYDVPQDLPAPL